MGVKVRKQRIYGTDRMEHRAWDEKARVLEEGQDVGGRKGPRVLGEWRGI